MKTRPLIYNVFDKLHPNMNRNECIEMMHEIANIKLKTCHFKRPLNTIDLIVGMDRLHVYNDVFNYPFSVDNKVYIPERNITKAITNDNIGKLIRTVGHELEHVYQTYTDQDDDINYNIYLNYRMPNNVTEQILNNYGRESLEYVNDYLGSMIDMHYKYLYVHSKMEYKANAMGTLYYGYHLKNYAKEETNPDRKRWLNKQVENIFLAQEHTDFDIKYIEESVKNLPQNKIQLGLLSLLYYAYDSQDFKYLILMNYNIAITFGLDKDFEKEFAHYYNEKFLSNNIDKVEQNQKNLYDNIMTRMTDKNMNGDIVPSLN